MLAPEDEFPVQPGGGSLDGLSLLLRTPQYCSVMGGALPSPIFPTLSPAVNPQGLTPLFPLPAMPLPQQPSALSLAVEPSVFDGIAAAEEEYNLYYDAIFAQHDPSVQQAIYAPPTAKTQQQKRLLIVPEDVEEDEESEVSGGGVGSSCHQCKSRRGLDSLSFCHRMFLKNPESKDKKVKYQDI